MGSEPIISLNTLEGKPYDMCDAEILNEVAGDWAKRLVRRNTWSRIPDLRLELVNRSRNHLARLCPKLKGAFASLASAGLIEIRFHQPESKIGWGIPWEFLLSSATENERQSTLLVVRHLVCDQPVEDPPAEPKTLLVHKNNPGYLGRYYRDNSFKREEKSVEAHLGLKALPPLHNESLESTKQKITKALPDVIHVAGVDGKQAAEFAPAGAGFDFSGGDSLIVAGPDGTPMAATGTALAPALCAADSKPSFVGLNFVNSGGDLAPSMVLNGAYGALGFLNDFDDIAAEVFYFQFYLAYRLSEWNLLDALRLAWYQSSTLDNERLRGTGIILWARRSLLDIERAVRGASHASGAANPPEDLLRKFADELEKPIPKAERRSVMAFAAPVEQINYSLLHNDRNLFQYFYIRKPQRVGTLKDLSVDVSLQAGPEPMSFHTSCAISGSILSLKEIVRLPLTSGLARGLREITRTQLSVRVEWEKRTVFDRSFPVSLMPIEQWQNDDINRKWLPSFVLPRDLSVSGVIDYAQPYLTALADTLEVGFDGYQKDAVKTQVKAIWWALIANLSLSYIGTPPVYGANAQRLRSPSSVLKGRRGTCIDLALLLASCLEYIDLHPLLFLLKGHAFAGYYRTPASSKEVYQWLAESGDPDGDPWVLGADFQPVLMSLIDKGEIIPIETTGLAWKWGIERAIAEAKGKLQEKGAFEWLMDIKLARERGVTPLPLLE